METRNFKFTYKIIALVLILALAAGFLFLIPGRGTAVDTSSMGAMIDYFAANGSDFELTSNSRFFLTVEPAGKLLSTLQLVQKQFAADDLPEEGVTLDIVWGDIAMLRDGDILIRMVDSHDKIGDEGYYLEVTSHVTVTALDYNGLLYGLNMLHKHFRAAGANEIQGFVAYDTPDTVQRAVSLDCGRKYLSKEWICNYIREMSWMGYNTLELHFSDDSGFRIDIWSDESYHIDYNGDGTKYNPANDLSWLAGSQVTSWTHDGSTGITGINFRSDPDKDKHLSTADLVEIIETAKEYNIDIIPAFDCPAHLDYTTWKYEQNYYENPAYTFVSTYDGKTYKASDNNGCINYTGFTDQNNSYTAMRWPYYTCINIVDAQSKAFLMELYIDIANFFKEYAGSTDFSIGADEVQLSTANISSSYSYAWGFNDFVVFINDLNELLNGKGYTVRMYNDFMATTKYTKTIEEDFASNIEILYWDSPLNPGSKTASNHTAPVSTLVAEDRVLYNCIQTNTYYVLRINETYGDARSESCTQWTFYHSDEENIYNQWYSADISEHGKVSSEDVPDVTGEQLGGAYFLVWNDYAALNTEVEMWNGVEDFALKTEEFYSLRNRMWSNTIKQWNWDINSSLSFENFETLRDSMGDFPGLEATTFDENESHANPVTMPEAQDPIELQDHTALTEALKNKLEQGDYTTASYQAYLDAFDAAVQVNNNNNATEKEMGIALQNLNDAIDALTIKTNTFTVVRKTTVNNTNYVIDSKTYNIPYGKADYKLFIPRITGYSFLTVEDPTPSTPVTLEDPVFTPLASGNGSGYLTGVADSDTTITIWYKSNADVSRLNALVEQGISEQGNYTDASWAAYCAALNAAKHFTLTASTRQSDVDAVVATLENTRNALVTPSTTNSITVEKLNGSFTLGMQVGLYIKTTPNIGELTVVQKTDTGSKAVTLDLCSGEVQTLTSGETVKYWVLFFTPEEAGTYTYVVSGNGTSSEITITIVKP